MVQLLKRASLDRRTVAFGLLASGGALLVGCSREVSRTADANQAAAEAGDPAPGERPAADGSQQIRLAMFRDPGCGCCGKWAEIARSAGFEISISDRADMAAFKRAQGLPEQLASCHTTLVDGYVVEGHVPIPAVQRLLRERPSIKGIAVPGMPLGSPGMEVPNGTKEAFVVLAFDAAGKVSPFTV